MNTVFFQKAEDVRQDFKWKDIFSEAFQPHSKKRLNLLLTRGIGSNVPSPSEMLDQWQKPWLFVRVFAAGLILSLAALFLWNLHPEIAVSGILIMVIPAFVMPLAVAVFLWEMNIPGDISLYEMLALVLLGGVLSLCVTGIIFSLVDVSTLAFLQGPLPEEIAKMAIVYLILTRGKYRYGTQGILIGGAIGVGFAAFESASYAWNIYQEVFIQSIQQTDNLDLIYKTISDPMLKNIMLRGFLAPGGHAVWAALYGGALALTKGDGGLKLSGLADKLVIAAWTGAFLLHTAWNFDLISLAGFIPDSWIIFGLKVESLYLKHIALMILAWVFLLFIMRRCIWQVLEVHKAYGCAPAAGSAGRGSAAASGRAADRPAALTVTAVGGVLSGKSFTLGNSGSLIFGRDPGRANVRFPSDTRGVSSIHCEIKWKDGVLVLIDRGSTYGTFFSNGKKLEPEVPYKLRDQGEFYLADEANRFTVKM